MEALPACQLRDVAQEALGVAVIGIDEGQFVSAGRWALPLLVGVVLVQVSCGIVAGAFLL